MDNDGGEIDWSGMANQSHWESWRFTGGACPQGESMTSKLLQDIMMFLFFDIESTLVWNEIKLNPSMELNET